MLTFDCFCGTLCGSLQGETDFEAITQSGVECHRVAEETIELTDNTTARFDKVVVFAKDVKSTLSGFRTDPKTVVKMMGYRDEMRDTIQLAGEVDDLARECVDKANEMNDAMQRGLNGLPEATRDAIEKELSGEEEIETRQDRELIDVDEAARELEICERDLGDVDVFTAAQRGNVAFEGIVQNGDRILAMFDRIRELSASIARITQAIMAEHSCCGQIRAVASQGKEMIRCLQMSAVISKMAIAAQRLIKALTGPMKVLRIKCGSLLDEINAAKKIKNFFNDMNLFNSRRSRALEM